MRTLYISDLDGTLLNRSARLDPDVARRLNRLIDEGLHFTYATARGFQTAAKVSAGLSPRLPLIVNNGVFVRNVDGTYLISHYVSPIGVAKLRDIFCAAQLYPLCYAMIGGQEKVTYLDAAMTPALARYLNERKDDPRIRCVNHVDALFEGDIYYFSLFGEHDPLAELYARIPADEYRTYFQQEIYDNNDWWLEITPKNASKAHAAQELKKLLGYDRIVCFGDQINDIPMFEIADESYAVANAAPRLKEMADGIIGANYEGGVVAWLERNGQKERSK